jgi:hypothetical protein
VRFLPGLFYDRGDEAITRAAPSIPFTLALPMAAGSRLRFLLAAYSLNGTYLGLQVRLECALSAPRVRIDCANIAQILRIECWKGTFLGLYLGLFLGLYLGLYFGLLEPLIASLIHHLAGGLPP